MSAALTLIDTDYTSVDYRRDLREVEKAAKARDTLVRKVRDWEDTNTIDLAHRILRMRESDHWRGPGMKDNDREFFDRLVEQAHITSAGWAKHLLMAGRALRVLEKFACELLPVGATQIGRLGSSWYLAHPQSIVNVWMAAVEEAGGQPGQVLVASKARRHKADLQSVEDSHALPYEQRSIYRQLAIIRRKLIRLHQQDAGPVEAFLRELSTSIRQEAREI